MKKTLSLILFLIISTASIYAVSWPPTSADDLNAKWLAGDKGQVLAYAEDRLSHDTNDILGLIIKWDYAISFMDLKSIRETAPKLKMAALKQNGVHFDKKKSWLTSGLEPTLKLLDTITPEMAAQEAHKGLITGKPMNMFVHIKALEEDGYFKQKNNLIPTTPSVSAPDSPTTKSPALTWLIACLSILAAAAFFLLRRFKS